MANRKRNIQLKLWVSQEEKDLIYFKMTQVPTDNIGAYIRKMSIDGYIINIDMSEIKKSNSELQIIGKNINQIAKRVNSTNSIYADDITELRELLKEIWQLQRRILSKLR